MYNAVFPRVLALSILSVATVLAQSSSPSSGVDLKSIDKSADPCKDFFQYACGNWVKNNPIPPQYARWGTFNQLRDRNEDTLHDILEDSAKNLTRSPVDGKIGGFYASCMNETAVDRAGFDPIKPGLERIAAIQKKEALATEIAQLHNTGVSAFFRFGVSPDADQSTINLANIDQGGLGLPDRSYYLDAKDEDLRKKYVAHVTKIFELIGVDHAAAAVQADSVLKLETALAKAQLDRVSRRNPTLTHHKTAVNDFIATVPAFTFQAYFEGRGVRPFEKLNVTVPDYFKALNSTLNDTDLAVLKSYLTWHFVSSNAPLLSKPFVDENFDFYSRTLTGAKELQPRWKRCVELVDDQLGEALGQKYVEKAFGGDAKEKTQQLVAIIEKQMSVDIDSLTWMSAATKQQAMTKLKGVTNKIGYPEKWRDYSSVQISPNDLVGNNRRADAFEIKRNINKLGKPVDRTEFGMTPPTVNAYYNPLENNINFPAGILQPPFYTNTADMAANLGAIGTVVGHELTHGFDDQGRRYDADGNLRDWWTKQDTEEFQKRVNCLVNQYSAFSPVEGANVNGKLTLGENGADNAGIRLSYMALLGALQDGTVSKDKIDGYTPQQRFFLGFAQVWCQNQRPESARQQVRTDPHSPGQFRVIGTVQNQPEFGQAFGCSAGQPMTPEHSCRVW